MQERLLKDIREATRGNRRIHLKIQYERGYLRMQERLAPELSISCSAAWTWSLELSTWTGKQMLILYL
jgi:hypothetical protein